MNPASARLPSARAHGSSNACGERSTVVGGCHVRPSHVVVNIGVWPPPPSSGARSRASGVVELLLSEPLRLLPQKRRQLPVRKRRARVRRVAVAIPPKLDAEAAAFARIGARRVAPR